MSELQMMGAMGPYLKHPHSVKCSESMLRESPTPTESYKGVNEKCSIRTYLQLLVNGAALIVVRVTLGGLSPQWILKLALSNAAAPRVERLVTASTSYAPGAFCLFDQEMKSTRPACHTLRRPFRNRDVHAECVSLGKSPNAGTELQNRVFDVSEYLSDDPHLTDR
jgi:hypothetical protein